MFQESFVDLVIISLPPPQKLVEIFLAFPIKHDICTQEDVADIICGIKNEFSPDDCSFSHQEIV